MRLIDADALLAAYDDEHKGPPGRARDLIVKAPTVEPKRGRWIDEHCSECGKYVFSGDADRYCPHCGARMEGGEMDD